MDVDSPVNPEKAEPKVTYESYYSDDFFFIPPMSTMIPESPVPPEIIENYDPSVKESVEYIMPDIIEDYNPGTE